MRMACKHPVTGKWVIADVPGDIMVEPYPILTKDEAVCLKNWATAEEPKTVWVMEPANNKFRVRENL